GEGRCPCCGEASAAERCQQCGGVSGIRQYRVLTRLGQSGHARTYLALTPEGERVVVKELAFAVVPSVVELEAFEREAKLLERIRHPRVPRHLESFREGEG